MLRANLYKHSVPAHNSIRRPVCEMPVHFLRKHLGGGTVTAIMGLAFLLPQGAQSQKGERLCNNTVF